MNFLASWRLGGGCSSSAVILALFVSVADAAERVVVSVADQVLVYSVDVDAGTLVRQQALPLPGAGPQGVAADRRTLYVSAKSPFQGRKASSAIATLRPDGDGRLAVAAINPIADQPVYLKPDPSGRWLSGAHYGPGLMSVWRISDGVCTGEAVVTQAVDKHAHSTAFSSDGNFLLVPTTTPNRVYQYRFTAATGGVTSNDPPFASGPSEPDAAREPRHLVFHPTLPIAYTSNERKQPGVGVWRWDAASGCLTPIQQLVSTRPGFTGMITTADLHLTPDARFLYVSNRDLTDRQATSGTSDLVGFRVDPQSGLLTLIDHTPCEHVPRFFAISTTGTWLCVGGQGDNRLGLYRIVAESGALTRLAQEILPGKPGWVSLADW